MEAPVRLSDFSDILQRDRLLRSEGDRQDISLSSTSRELFNETKRRIPRASNQIKLKDLISPSVSRYNSSKHNLRARSHSPIGSPPSSNKVREKTIVRCDFTAAHGEEELMQSLDAGKIEEINDNIDGHCSLMDQSDEASMQRLLYDAQKDLSILGFCYSQLWLLEPGGGLSLKTTNDGNKVNLSPQRTIDLFESIGIQRSSMIQVQSDISESAQSKKHHQSQIRYPVTVLTEADLLWEELLNILESNYTSESASNKDRRHHQWKAIHLIPISSSNSIKGIIFATETETFTSATVAKRISSINTSRIRIVLATQWYKQLAKAMGLRLNALHEEKMRISNIESTDEDIVKTEMVEGLLKLNEDLSEMTDIYAVFESLASSGVTLFKGSMCFIFSSNLQKNESNEGGNIIDGNCVTVYTADNNSSTAPISPINVTNRGLITTLIGNHDSPLLRTKCINGKSEQEMDSEKYFDSSRNKDDDGSSSSSKIERKLTTLKVSKDELMNAGLSVRENSENYTIICLSIPTKKMDKGLHVSDSVNKDDFFCSFILAFPCDSSSLTSAPNNNSNSSNDQINNTSIHHQKRVKTHLNAFMKIASYALCRIGKSGLQTIQKYEKRNQDMTKDFYTLRDSLKTSEDIILKEKRIQNDLRACMLCTFNLAVFASKAAEVSTLKDLGTCCCW